MPQRKSLLIAALIFALLLNAWMPPQARASALTETPPYVGVVVHTMYAPGSGYHWKWYQNSSSFSETHAQPALGFYDQTRGTEIEADHYDQLRRARVDYALFSWYGQSGTDVTDRRIDDILAAYWSTFAARNMASKAAPIRMAVLMEFASEHYQDRIAYLKANFYDRYPAQVLSYQGRPVLALGFDKRDSDANDVVRYARSRGFFVVNGRNGPGGDAAFIGIARGPNRVTPLFAAVSPGVDVSGKAEIFDARNFQTGCGTRVQDPAALDGVAVQSNGTGCTVVSTAQAASGSPRGKVAYAIFRVKTSDTMNVQGSISVSDAEGETVRAPISRHAFAGDNAYAHLVLQFDHRPQAGPITASVEITAGTLSVDRIWITPAAFRRASLAEYDSQWQTIEDLPLSQRPVFITIASLNAWEEGTEIEANTVSGTQFLDRTAYWVEHVKK